LHLPFTIAPLFAACYWLDWKSMHKKWQEIGYMKLVKTPYPKNWGAAAS
jgi:hypothetical protein